MITHTQRKVDAATERAQRRLGVQKFCDQPCRRCGASEAVLNGAWLRLRREMAGLTLRELARRLGYSAAYLSDIERNRRNCLPKVREAYEAL